MPLDWMCILHLNMHEEKKKIKILVDGKQKKSLSHFQTTQSAKSITIIKDENVSFP